jgi:hypothetical protein
VTRSVTPKPRGLRRVERWFVGLVMTIVAFLLERVVLRSVRKQGREVPASSPRALTSRGGEVDLDVELD